MQSAIGIVVLLGVLIFVHEIGHFLAAKLFGIGVLKFSLGFGRKIVGKKIGETEYVLSLIPLGGYVKMLGEGQEEPLADEDRCRAFSAKPVWVRAIVVFPVPFQLPLGHGHFCLGLYGGRSHPDE